ncbi:cupin domain-containing protein [Actinopolymorpha pittospori]
MDSVSHLIRLARLDATVDKRCLLARATAMEVPACGEGKAPFHLLLDGVCVVELPDRVIELRAGDFILLPGGSAHRVLTSGTTDPSQGVVEEGGGAFSLVHSRKGESVIDLFCGHYASGPGAGTILLRSLPDPSHVSFRQAGDADATVRTLTNLIRQEATFDGPGTAAILSLLCNTLLAMVLRTSGGRLAGSGLWTAADDERLRTVVDEVLRAPGADWTIARLARVAAMSRATFVRHFTQATGMTVREFLTHVRLMAAAELLTETDLPVAAVAADVGYNSDSAFSRAFRLATGSTPARFRRSLKHGSGTPVGLKAEP